MTTALQCCVCLSHTSTWISHRYTHTPSLLNARPPSPSSSHPSGVPQSTGLSSLYHLLRILHIVMYLFPCHSPNSSHSIIQLKESLGNANHSTLTLTLNKPLMVLFLLHSPSAPATLVPGWCLCLYTFFLSLLLRTCSPLFSAFINHPTLYLLRETIFHLLHLTWDSVIILSCHSCWFPLQH